MTAIFVNSAIEELQRIDAQPQEKRDLSHLMKSLSLATSSEDLLTIPDTVWLARRGSSDVYALRNGKMHALVTVDQNMPDRMVVASVFRDEDADDKVADRATANQRSDELGHMAK